MKKVMVFAVLTCVLLASASSYASSSDSLMASRVVHWLQQNQLDSLEAHFTARMRQALPKVQLQKVWRDVQKKMGKLVAWHITRIVPVQHYRVVLGAATFEKGNLLIKITLDASQRIAGLFFQPAATPSQKPRPESGAIFLEKEMTFGKKKFPLPGILTLPRQHNIVAAVLFVHGSGPQDRDETIGQIKVFRDMAHGLARYGIASFRYDKRTKVHLAKIDLHSITVEEEVLEDVREAVKFLKNQKELSSIPLFVIGHSLGGTLVPIILQQNPQVKGGIILAGTLRPLPQVAIEQMIYLHTPSSQLEPLKKLAAKIEAHQAPKSEMFLGAPAIYYYHLASLKIDQRIRQIERPLFIANGGKDYQVTEKDFLIYKKVLKNKPNVTFRWYPQLSHAFTVVHGQPSPEDYRKPAHVAQEIIADIAQWIVQHLN